MDPQHSFPIPPHLPITPQTPLHSELLHPPPPQDPQPAIDTHLRSSGQSSSNKRPLEISVGFGDSPLGQQKHYERFFSALSRFDTPDQEKTYLHQVFTTFDENGDGRISIDEMQRSLEKLGVVMPVDFLISTVEEGSVDFEGFRSLYRTISQVELEDHGTPTGKTSVDSDLLAAFRIFDQDHDNYISASELQSVLHSLGFLEGTDLAECINMISKVDSDGDGRVSFSEFEEMMNNLFF